MCIYICIYIYREREREREFPIVFASSIYGCFTTFNTFKDSLTVYLQKRIISKHDKLRLYQLSSDEFSEECLPLFASLQAMYGLR